MHHLSFILMLACVGSASQSVAQSTQTGHPRPTEKEETDNDSDEGDAETVESSSAPTNSTPDAATKTDQAHFGEGQRIFRRQAADPVDVGVASDPLDVGVASEPGSEASRGPSSTSHPETRKSDSADSNPSTDLKEALIPDPREDMLLPPPHKMNDCLGGVTQYSTGVCCSGLCCGTTGVVGGALSVVALFIPGSVLWYSVIGCCIGGPGIAVAPASGVSGGVWLREWLGQRRGPWLWPLLAAYATEFASVALIAAAMVTGTGLVALFLESIPGANPMLSDPVSWIDDPAQWGWAYLGGGGGVFIAGFLVGIFSAIFVPSLAGVLSYHLLGVPKSNEDRRFRMPGCLHANLEVENEDNDKNADEDGGMNSVKDLKMNQKQRKTVNARRPGPQDGVTGNRNTQNKSGRASGFIRADAPMVY